MGFPQKVRDVDGLQFASLKKFLLSTACNELPPKSKDCRRVAISFPRKVFAIDGLQSASLKKFLLLTACNSLPSKSKGYRRPEISFPKGGKNEKSFAHVLPTTNKPCRCRGVLHTPHRYPAIEQSFAPTGAFDGRIRYAPTKT